MRGRDGGDRGDAVGEAEAVGAREDAGVHASLAVADEVQLGGAGLLEDGVELRGESSRADLASVVGRGDGDEDLLLAVGFKVGLDAVEVADGDREVVELVEAAHAVHEDDGVWAVGRVGGGGGRVRFRGDGGDRGGAGVRRR